MRVGTSTRVQPQPFVSIQRVETCIGHAHKRLKRSPEYSLQKAAVATRQPKTSDTSDVAREDRATEGE